MDVTDLWWLSLGIAAVVTVVVAVLLGLVVAAAKSIDRHAGHIWLAGKQIAGNTVAIWMLERTNELAESMVERAGVLERGASSLNETLGALADSTKRR
jgi:hypothetical protein